MIVRLLALLTALAASTAADARWREASTRHFVIYSEQPEAELRRFAQDLERFDATLRLQLGRRDIDISPSSRLTVYVLPDVRALQRFLQAGDVAGVYQPRYSGSIVFTARRADRHARPDREAGAMTPEIVLFHEYTHHFINNNFAFGAPIWFSEGYPEFWSTIRFEEDGRVQFGIPAWHRTGELMLGRPIHVRELLTLQHPIRSAETTAVAYGRGWLLTHYLHYAPNRRGQLDSYLRALADGQSPAQAAQVFGDLNQLNEELVRYLRSPRFSSWAIPAERVPPANVAIREVSAGEEAVMSVRMRSKRGVDSQQAAELVPQARRAAAPFPNDAIAQVTLAEAEFDAGNFVEAEAAAQRAVAADPRLVDAQLYLARAMWARIAAAGDSTPQQWEEVRGLLTAAQRIDPNDPEPLALIYESYGASGLRPTVAAIEGLYRAHQLAPEDRTLRLSTGRELLLSGRAADARATLAPFIGDSHAGPLGPLVAEVLAILDGGDTRAALNKLREGLRPRQSGSANGS